LMEEGIETKEDKLPKHFIAAWHRLSISIESGSPYEDQDVIWCQASGYSASLRLPLSPSSSSSSSPPFLAGTSRVSWKAERNEATWITKLDAGGSVFSDRDVGCLFLLPERGERNKVLMRETGWYMEGEKKVNYEELWEKLDEGLLSPPPTFVMESKNDDGESTKAMMVLVGTHLLIEKNARTASPSCYSVRHASFRSFSSDGEQRDASWQDVSLVGEEASSLPLVPFPLPSSWTVNSKVSLGGLEWLILERQRC